MRPLIGITCSTLSATERERVGMKRYAVPSYYVARIEEAGGIPVVLPSVGPERADEFAQRLDAVLLSGGPDVEPHAYGAEPHPRLGEVDPARDRFEIALVKAARAAGLPVFGVCRGMQVTNVAFGGTLIQDIPAQVAAAIQHDQSTVDLHQPSHTVAVVAGTNFHRLVGTASARVNSFHHQAVDRLADGFRVTARSSDGVLEAMERTDGPWFQCVQWHPERMADDPVTRSLFRAFVEAAQHDAPPVPPVPPANTESAGAAAARPRPGRAGARR